MSDVPPRGPELLRAALKSRDMTQGDLEKKLGVARGVASRWLSGERVPDLKFALAIESLLRVPARSWVSGGLRTGTTG